MSGTTEHEERVHEKVRRMELGLDLWTGKPLPALVRFQLGFPEPPAVPVPPSAEALARMRAFENVALAELE
jgi:hypothetical protein